VISDEIKLRREHEGSELFDKLEGLENDMTGAVTPASLEAIQQPAVQQKRKSLCRYRGPTGVAAQMFEPHSVMSRNACTLKPIGIVQLGRINYEPFYRRISYCIGRL